MDDLVIQLVKLTLEIVTNLERVSYEQLIAFVEQREQLIQQLQQIKLTHEDKDRLQETIRSLLSYDSSILSKMKYFKDEASSAIMKIEYGRRQQAVYNAAYTPDSVFFDKIK